MVRSLAQDLRYAVRSLLKSPGLTLAAVLTLALGIGANALIFGVVDRVLLRPVPYAEPGRVLTLGWSWGEGDGTYALTRQQYDFWREHSRAFRDLSASAGNSFVLTGGGVAEQLRGMNVSEGYFRVTGLQPALGRAFLPAEDVPGGPRVAILSDGAWRQRFGGDPGVVGRTVTLSGEPYTVVGVMPPDFAFAAVDVLAPLGLARSPNEGGNNYAVLGRLAPGATVRQAEEEARALTSRFREEHPGSAREQDGLTLTDVRKFAAGSAAPTLWILFGAVGFVLLIACTNVVSLLLARTAARRSELAVRTALGARRARLVGQLVAESVLLALAGGALGLALAAAGLRALVALAPEGTAGLHHAELSLAVYGFALVVSLTVGVVVGLASAWRGARPHDLMRTLREEGRSRMAGRASGRLRYVLLGAQAMLSVVLLVGAGLLMASFFRLKGVELGFGTDGLAAMELRLPPERYADTESTWRFEQAVMERLARHPAITAVGSASSLPLVRGLNMPATIEGPGPVPEGIQVVEYRAVSPAYFRTLGATLRQGREFTGEDGVGAPPVAVVNEAFAKHFFGGDALGGRLTVGKGFGGGQEEAQREIVGVIGDIRDIGLDQEARPTVFVPRAQAVDGITAAMNGWFPITVVVRATDFEAAADAMRAAASVVDPLQPVLRIRSIEQVVSTSVAEHRFRVLLLGTFAAVALVLTGIGIYGVVSYAVRQRTHEIGVRMALGARRVAVVRMVVRQGMRSVLLGLGLGLALAYVLARALAGLLYEVSPADPVTFAAVALVLTAVAALACYLPARRAARVDPVVALRSE